MDDIKMYSRKQMIKQVIFVIITLIIIVVFFFPIFWMLVSSLKSDAEALNNNVSFWFETPQWTNYTSQLSGQRSLLTTLPNSVFVSVCNVLVSGLLGIPAAYGLAHYKNMKGISVIILIFLLTMMLPPSLALTPLYLLFAQTQLLNTQWSSIIAVATISIPFMVIVLRPVFKDCPQELEDAARIDGCNTLTTFLRIMLPICRPGIITCVCFSFVHGWNNLVYNLTFCNKPEFQTMTSAIYWLMDDYGISWSKVMAYATMVSAPVVILFVVAQKYIIGGMTSGSVKG